MTNAAAVPRPNTAKPADDLIGVDNSDTDGLVEERRDLVADPTTCSQNSMGRKRLQCVCV